MTCVWDSQLSPQTVRGTPLTRFAAVTPPPHVSTPNPIRLVLLGALGKPRLWHEVLGLATEVIRPLDDQPFATTVTHLKRQLAKWAGAILERDKPDLGLLAAEVTPLNGTVQGQVDLFVSGPFRCYLYHQGQPQRMSPRQERRDGVLATDPVRSSFHSQADDLLLLGSVSAFSVRALANVAATLNETHTTPVHTFSNLLVAPTAQAGIGAAAIAVRM